MNICQLILTRRSLYSWLTKCREETISADKKLEIIMMSLADMCQAMTGLNGDELAKRENDISNRTEGL